MMRNVHRFENEGPHSFQLVTRSQKTFHHFLIMIVEVVKLLKHGDRLRAQRLLAINADLVSYLHLN